MISRAPFPYCVVERGGETGSPKAVRILFSKIPKHMIPSTTSFLHQKHAGEKSRGRAVAGDDHAIFGKKLFFRPWALCDP